MTGDIRLSDNSPRWQLLMGEGRPGAGAPILAQHKRRCVTRSLVSMAFRLKTHHYAALGIDLIWPKVLNRVGSKRI